MNDPTEAIRREEQRELNERMLARSKLELLYRQVWDTDELRRDYEVKGFMAPYVIVKRKIDGKLGSLQFQHAPRFYFNWQED